MKNKVISLILIVPLVLMFCVFSAAKVASLKVPIAVSSVTLFHENEEILNLAEGDEFQINAQVMPRNATNKKILYFSERLNNKPYPNIEIDENGLLKASGYGSALITVKTLDGAYKKSFMLKVTSTMPSDIDLKLNITTNIFVGDEFDTIATVLPIESINKNVRFFSNNSNVVKINEISGHCQAISSGVAILTARIDEGLTGTIQKNIEVVVLPVASSSLITFDGKQNLTKKIFSNNFTALMEINFSSLYELGKTLNTNDIILEYNNSKVQNVSLNEIENNNGIYKYSLNITGLNTDNFNLKARLNLESFIDFYSEINLEKVVDLNDLEINLSNFNEFIKKGQTSLFDINVLPQDFNDFTISAYFINDNIDLWWINNNTYQLKGLKTGDNTLVVEIMVDGIIIKTFEKEIKVLNPPTSFSFNYIPQNYGIEELLTIGNEHIVNDEYIEKLHNLKFTSDDVNYDYIEFISSNEEIAKFVDGKLKIVGEGKVTITAIELQSKLILGEVVSGYIDTLELRCVKGVEVGSKDVEIENYKDLVKATKDNKQVVITNDIDLGEKLVEVNENTGVASIVNNRTESECAKILNEEINQIETSSEWNYYKYNKDFNAQTPPLINYIIKFTNNCYGNGYVLNANNITNMLKDRKTGELFAFAKFKGPLDLVALPGASVKAQDNICFIASDNVMLNNVELVGANMHGLDSNDLSELNCVGTVLEIMGDNVKVVNSRINNGRTCVRVYGKESGNLDKINVLIESCIISNAREFLVKMGTNAKIHGEFKNRDTDKLNDGVSDNVWEECSPKIQNFRHLNDGTLSQIEYNDLVAEYKESPEFQALIKTNLTLKNCVLHTSGLFSIGLESSFAGPALDGGKWNNYDFNAYGWRQIAGTSYPTQLNLEGNIKIYDWKNISNINSSILIEGGLFDFNISQMIENLYNNGQFNDIISIIDGEKYAHGGIVLYGGGKNYALVNTDLENVEELNNYSINLDSLNTNLTSILKYASGRENFRMFMYGKNSQFNYYQQVIELENGTAYQNIGKYIF